MGERTKGFAISVLRYAVVGLGMLGQRLALGAEIAMPPQMAVQAVSIEQLSVNPLLLSQVQPISGNVPVESAASIAGSSIEPLPSIQETTSIARMPSSGQKRRRPRMAGIPEGLRPVLPVPEPSADTRLAESTEKQTTGTEILLGSVAAQEDEVAVLDYEEDAYSPGAIARQRAEEQGADRKYALAPIHWRGLVFYRVAWKRSRQWGNTQTTKTMSGQPIYASKPSDSLERTIGALISANTYIMHPWVATVSGRLGVVSQDLSFKSMQSYNNNQFLGGAKLYLFPLSRYPFTMSYDLNDSRATSEFTDNLGEYDNITKKLSLIQKYRPVKGLARYDFGYDYNNSTYQNYSLNYDSQATNQFSGSYTYTSLHGNYTNRFGKTYDQPFLMYGSHETTTQSSVPGGGIVRDIIRANHIYTPEEYLLTLRNNASFFQSRFKQNTSRNLQFGSDATWQPEALDNPLILRGGAHIYLSQTENGDVSRSSKIFRANVKASYNKWAHLYLSGGGTLTATNAKGNSNLSSTQFGRAVYKPGWTSLKYGYRYNKWAEAGFSNQVSSNGNSNHSMFAGASHTLNSKISRRKYFGRDMQVTAQANQSLYLRTDKRRGTSETLTNSASVTWIPIGLRSRLPIAGTTFGGGGVTGRSRGAASANLISSVGLYARDVRVYGNKPSHHQSFKLSLGAGAGAGGGYLATASGYGANADLGIEYSRSTSGDSSGGLAGNASWGHKFVYNYRYKKAKVFNVKRLNYKLAFNANIDPELRAHRQISFESSRDIASNSEALSYGVSLDQTLGYRIGLNEAVLKASIANRYGIYTGSLILQFRAWRNFGN